MIEIAICISSEMNIMDAELKENESICFLELLQVRVNEASKCSKMKISNCQSVVCENCRKLGDKSFT